MKFNVYLADDIKEYLEKQYKDYLKKRTMTKKEQRAVREWVKMATAFMTTRMVPGWMVRFAWNFWILTGMMSISVNILKG